MKHSRKAWPLALVLLGVEAQEYSIVTTTGPASTYTITNPTGASGVVTSYYPVCTGVTITSRLSVTQSYCPGTECESLPSGLAEAGGEASSTERIAIILETCATGMADKTITITEPCPCTADHPMTALPGYTTTEVYCDACETPSTQTVFVPCANATAAIAPGSGATIYPAATTPTSSPGSGSPGSPGSSPNNAAPGGSGAYQASSGSGANPAAPGAGTGSYTPQVAPGSGGHVSGTNTTVGSGAVGSGSSETPPMTAYTGAASSVRVAQHFLTPIALLSGLLALFL